jgi:hypothetical protein
VISATLACLAALDSRRHRGTEPLEEAGMAGW